MRALFICTYGDFAATFERNNISILQSMGYEVHVASNFVDASKNRNIHILNEMQVTLHNINFERNPFSKQGIKNIKELNSLIEQYSFQKIDCHNPVCGIMGRICGKRNHVSNIIYTAHGFHFFKGAPLKNWLLYFSAEWICSWMTDVLITINKEDYERAKKHLHAKKTEYIPGVGVDVEKFAACYVDKKTKCHELGIPDDKFILLSVGELQERENHKIVIETLGQMQNHDIYYLIAGQGILREEYEQLIQNYQLGGNVKLLGYRTDIDELCEIADCFVYTAFHERLPVALLEAMASGLPIICANLRDASDLVEDNKGGKCISAKSVEEIQNAILEMYSNKLFCRQCGCYNLVTVKKYSIENIEDIFNDTCKHIFKQERVKHIYTIIQAARKRKELRIGNNDFVIISVGELNSNKNHEVIIRAMAELDDSHVKYIVCGQGELEGKLKQQIEQYGLEQQVMLLGYRTDIRELLIMSDLFAFPSKREGLSRSLMEAMASGLPVVCGNIRGNCDLIDEGVGGYLIDGNEKEKYANAIKKIMNESKMKELMGKNNQMKIRNYNLKNIETKMKWLYETHNFK